MKIRIKISLSGTDFSYYAGQEVEVDDIIAKDWIDADYAEIVEIVDETTETKPVKTTTKVGAKNATT